MEADQVKAYFQSSRVVEHYARATRSLGLWASEEKIFTRVFKSENTLIDLGTGTGRIPIGLCELGFHRVLGIDFEPMMIAEARRMAKILEYSVHFRSMDVRNLEFEDNLFEGAIFSFNGLMQIPGREDRRLALSEIFRVIEAGAYFVFTTHDRDQNKYREFWAHEKQLWRNGRQKTELLEYGDRCESTEFGNLFIHIPSCEEVREDLRATGFQIETDVLRSDIANESQEVRDFSDECRFWIARKPNQSDRKK